MCAFRSIARPGSGRTKNQFQDQVQVWDLDQVQVRDLVLDQVQGVQHLVRTRTKSQVLIQDLGPDIFR